MDHVTFVVDPPARVASDCETIIDTIDTGQLTSGVYREIGETGIVRYTFESDISSNDLDAIANLTSEALEPTDSDTSVERVVRTRWGLPPVLRVEYRPIP